jgi:hypothetical protein
VTIPLRAGEPVKDVQVYLADGKPTRYQLAFCWRQSPSGPSGHAFLALGKWVSENAVEVNGFGFYPKAETWLGQIIGPGQVKMEGDTQLVLKSTDFLFHSKPSLQDGSCRVLKFISKGEYALVEAKMDKWKTSSFHLGTNNCVKMMDEIAKDVGLAVPETANYTFPKTYVETLWKLNTPGSLRP